jgi:Na+/H+ antiporter NhaD/arsenite permease-like protein
MVSNIGGSLTPLGDPPLFLGYLKGVPFEWTFQLLPEMVTAIAILSVIYFIWDTNAYSKEDIFKMEILICTTLEYVFHIKSPKLRSAASHAQS